MKITTKFDLGQEVFVKEDNRVRTVTRITIDKDDAEPDVDTETVETIPASEIDSSYAPGFSIYATYELDYLPRPFPEDHLSYVPTEVPLTRQEIADLARIISLGGRVDMEVYDRLEGIYYKLASILDPEEDDA